LRTIATGVLEAARQADITFRKGGQVTALPIREGQMVRRGELLAEVEDAELQMKLTQTRLALDEAIVNKKDLLIANGGDAESDSSVSAQKLELILTLSGYNKARHNIRQTEYELDQTKVFAPFDGVVADIEARAFQRANTGERICTLIDPHSFEVVFSMMESEALQLNVGQPVLATPLAAAARQYRAQITTINPQVDAQGLVRVKAALQNGADKRLFEGQQVKVIIEKRLPDQLVIPKNARSIRAGREVVFTYDEATGKARWHYVQSSHENDEEVVIETGLESGMLVIWDGHLNLSHDTKVSVAQ
jgi:RND family efflux transporter MFP subunit